MGHWVESPAGAFSARLRPFAVVDSMDDLQGPSAGKVRLPGRLWWSEPRNKTWDLSDPADLMHLYGLLLREAGPADLSAWINRSRLLECWDELVLPSYVRACWQPLIAAARGRPLDADRTATAGADLFAQTELRAALGSAADLQLCTSVRMV